MDHQGRRWTFLTNHARVLRAVARDPDARLRTIAAIYLITERAVQAILADLEQAGYLHRQRVGRRNQYTLSLDQPLRHPGEAHLTLRALVDLAVDRETGTAAQPPKTASASATVSNTRRT
ncbi:helix-turn-helix transcriptional regulator [Streptomyces sp. NBC_00996]|uniref:helix-turn-helix transcriptional regulator n=1 Tax=Streptomyces sp. NBC_00996 TaxID=2903710 RepID=UPI003868135B|nr:transcriptional regulator [Streptomyces sp. NBC_00996]